MKIVNHRVAGARAEITKTKKGGIITPRGIVLHYTAGWTTEGDVHTLAKSDRQASAHGVLGRDGQWVQIVPFNIKAWHAGPSKYTAPNGDKFSNLNDTFIGIEIANAGWIRKLSNGNFQDQYGSQIKPNGQFIGAKRTTPKENPPPQDWPTFTHRRLAHGMTKDLYYWEPYTSSQLDALDELVAALIAKYPTIEHIVSHEEIDTRGWKTDPGPMFPMRRYTKLLENRADSDEDDSDTPPPAAASRRPPPPAAASRRPPPPAAAPQTYVIVTKEPDLLPWYKRWNVFWK